MKKLKQPRKLRLNLETVKVLKPDDLKRVSGGDNLPSSGNGCNVTA